MHTYMLPSGLEIRLAHDHVEFWRNGLQLLVMTPQEYGETMRWIEGTLRSLGTFPWDQHG